MKQDEDEDSVAFPPDGEAGEEDETEMEVALDTGTVFNVSVIKGDESLVCVFDAYAPEPLLTQASGRPKVHVIEGDEFLMCEPE